MSRVMLHGVLNMPAELWDSSNPFDSMQRQYTYFEASKLIFKQDDMIAELEKELEAAMTFNVDVVRCLSRIASVENHNEVPAYIDMSRRCIKTIEAKQAKALKEGKQ
jgi:hypothetical protein